MTDGIAKIDEWDDWDAYPKSWSRGHVASLPRGVKKLDDGIRRSAIRRLEQIRSDLEKAGIHYPREEVRAALAYWQIFV